MKNYIGISLGASTISLVKLRKSNGEIELLRHKSIPHNGDPKAVTLKEIAEMDDYDGIVATGRKFRHLVNLPLCSEPEATELAYRYIAPDYKNISAIASLGGETFIVYHLDRNGRISDVTAKNQCASGTGEFYFQQLKRMDLSVEQANDLARDAKPFRVSGRCSVFCKSDCTHALNKGVPKANVTAGLARMMADKALELTAKRRNGRVMIVGGVTLNNSVVNFMRQDMPDLAIPPQAHYFEALGAALYAADNAIETTNEVENILKDSASSFVFHKPLNDFVNMVTFHQARTSKAMPGDECVLGLDVGSTTTKAVVIRRSDKAILASVYLYTHGDPVSAARKCYQELIKQLPESIKISGLGTTGSGRQIAGLHALTEGIFNEIVAHATAAIYFDPEVETIFEIGGQDAKYTNIVNIVPADYAMNEACSAGTGSFIEEAAHEALSVDVKDIEPLAMQATTPPNFSDQCAAFINSDIKTALQENLSRNDILAGLVYSICLNYVNRVKGSRPIGAKVFMQGGVCYNKAIPIAMAALTGRQIVVPPEPGLMGAFGVALEVDEKIELGLLAAGEFNMNELAGRKVKYMKPFTCHGGSEGCDRSCEINLIEIDGRKYPFGGACDKYYNQRKSLKIDPLEYDYVHKRNELMFGKYAPLSELPDDAVSVGINYSYQTHTLYPLYHHFFSQLGCRIVLSEEVREEGLERENTSLCYPGQLSLCLFQDLVEKSPDFYFVPEIIEMPGYGQEHQRIDFNCTCAFLNAEPLILRQAYNDYGVKDKMLMPMLTFANGYDKEEDRFVEIGQKVSNADEDTIRRIYREAIEKLEQFNKELLNIGRNLLNYLGDNPEETAIVLLGRPYNAFTETANKGIPRKIASRGVYVIPFDMLDYKDQEIDDNQYWESGKKILKAAKIIKSNPQLFATYVTNFSCAVDSFVLTSFRTMMGNKPALTLELDGHTADAGINTRIDAAIDIIANYRKLSLGIKDPDYSKYLPAKVIKDGERSYFVSSDGDKVPLDNDKIVFLVPSMGDLSTRLFAAALRSIGIHAKALPEGNPRIMKYARANTTGKECLPLLLIVGSLVDYMEHDWDGEKYIVYFQVQGAGNCRVGQYPVFLRDYIKRNKLRNVTTLALSNEDAFAGMGANFDIRGIKAIMAGDVLEDVRTAIMANAIDPESSLNVFNREFDWLCRKMEKNPDKFFDYLKKAAKRIRKEAPAARPIEESNYIALVGEIYVRREHFSHKWLNKRFAEKGFVLKDAYITEWIFYVDYLIDIGLLEPEESAANKRDRFVRNIYMRYAERRIKKNLSKSGYYEFSKTEIKPILDHSKHVIPLEFKGEPGLTLGIALNDIMDKYCGVINLGPFGCMPTRCAEAISMPELTVEGKVKARRLNNKAMKLPEYIEKDTALPFLTIETDGNVYPQIIEARLETFTLQAERMARLMKLMKLNGKASKEDIKRLL